MSKTASKGLMGLRFMQNAQRAKQQAQADFEQAKIKDEAEWEVSQEIKDAWGIGSSSSASTSSVIHESSYLPFLFASSAAETSDGETQAKPKGRRSFNTKGKEVETVKAEPEPAPEEDAPESEPSKRITSISGFRAPLPTKAASKPTKGVKGPNVQELIRQDVTKREPAPLPPAIPTSAAPTPKPARAAPSGFLKPAGVDAPVVAAPKNSAGKKKKRDRDDSGDGEGKKRKRKNEKASGVHMVE
ncbi:hypothetical protein PsYK624_050650 [Phanerochaete sordida]|uniref:Uncharacterized protein n=1 Tax=Phanerochaete sordida TaxID=48140 RepID=A0A9P3LCK7_9APHY|nr:hypothetical protein PsYK624_050650 [Phanerochaete sordida]